MIRYQVVLPDLHELFSAHVTDDALIAATFRIYENLGKHDGSVPLCIFKVVLNLLRVQIFWVKTESLFERMLKTHELSFSIPLVTHVFHVSIDISDQLSRHSVILVPQNNLHFIMLFEPP